MTLDVLLFGLVATLCVSVVVVVAVTLQRLTGKATLHLDLGSRETEQAREVAEQLRADLAELTQASQVPQPLRNSVTSFVTAPLNKGAKVTLHTETGETFEVPQERLPASQEK